MRRWLLLAGLSILGISFGCQTVPPPPKLAPVSWGKHLAFSDDGDAHSFLQALRQSRQWLARQRPTKILKVASREFTPAELDRALAAVEAHVAQFGMGPALNQRLAELFDLYESIAEGSENPVLATGYYVPLVEGSFAPAPEYRVPVYGVPSDLITISLGDFDQSLTGKKLRGRLVGQTFVPYWERKDIREGKVLAESAPVVAWVKDELDLFIIEIQGSGIVRDQAGQQQVIGYAGENGRPYRAIGKLLLEENRIPREQMSMQAIKAYLRANPHDLGRVLSYNQSYVFFRLLDRDVLGNLGAPLTAGRSIATDQKQMPPGALAFLSVEKPHIDQDGAIKANGRIERFVFNQDTGGAIRGAGRVDFFWGAGDDAEHMAGAMQHRGRFFLLVPKTVVAAAE